MNDSRLPHLAERHRKVLRLYGQRYRLKQIARELSLSEHSVNTYLTEAVQILGVGGRQAAAEALARDEEPSQSSIPQISAPAEPPFQRLPEVPQSGDGSLGSSSGFLPLRPKSGAPNTLPSHVRLLWMLALLIALIVGVAIAVALYSVYVKPMEALLR